MTLSRDAVDCRGRRPGRGGSARILVLPGGEGAEHGRGEGLVDLEEVEVRRRVRPLRASSRGTAYARAISRPSLPWTKSTAAASASTTAASAGRSRASAQSSDASSTVEAPSVSGVELPAVMVAGVSEARAERPA